MDAVCWYDRLQFFLWLWKIKIIYHLVRGVLSLISLGTFSKLLGSVEKEFGTATAAWFTMVCASQYHFMYYISRPLPNIMALPLGKNFNKMHPVISTKRHISVLLAYNFWLKKQHKKFVYTAAAAIIIFRAELALLLGILLLLDLVCQRISMFE